MPFSIRTLLPRLACAMLLPFAVPATIQTVSAASTIYYVSPTGSDAADGRSDATPLKSIQTALNRAQPGDTIQLAAGTYRQDVVSQRNGTASAPITIAGPADAVLVGGGDARIVEIRHDYLTLRGFTLDGQHGPGTSAGDFRDKLLYVIGSAPKDGVQGLKVLGMTFRNAGGECVRLRYFAQQNEIANSTFQNCGIHDFRFGAGGKNGEAIYIGTAPEQRGDGKNPTADVDVSADNWVHHNTFDTQGNECVDIKEGTTRTIVEYNRCTGQLDPNSAGFDSRGNGNIFRYNESYGNMGAGVRLGGDTATDGIDNDVYSNVLRNNAAGGIRFQRDPQRIICGNQAEGNGEGAASGTYGRNYAIDGLCPGGTPPPPSEPVVPVPQPLPRQPQQCAVFQVGGAELIEAELASRRSSRFSELREAGRSNGIALATPRATSPSAAQIIQPVAMTHVLFMPLVQGGASSTIDIDMQVSATEAYTIWLLGYGPDSSSDSFTLQIDGGTSQTIGVSRSGWEWRNAGSIKLSAGSHRIQIGEREAGAALDAVAITRGSTTPQQTQPATCR